MMRQNVKMGIPGIFDQIKIFHYITQNNDLPFLHSLTWREPSVPQGSCSN